MREQNRHNRQKSQNMGTSVNTVSQSQNKQIVNKKAQKASMKFKNHMHCE